MMVREKFCLLWIGAEMGLPEDKDFNAKPRIVSFLELSNAVHQIAEGASDGPTPSRDLASGKFLWNMMHLQNSNHEDYTDS